VNFQLTGIYLNLFRRRYRANFGRRVAFPISRERTESKKEGVRVANDVSKLEEAMGVVIN
jgi:hypothetical protein